MVARTSERLEEAHSVSSGASCAWWESRRSDAAVVGGDPGDELVAEVRMQTVDVAQPDALAEAVGRLAVQQERHDLLGDEPTVVVREAELVDEVQVQHHLVPGGVGAFVDPHAVLAGPQWRDHDVAHGALPGAGDAAVQSMRSLRYSSGSWWTTSSRSPADTALSTTSSTTRAWSRAIAGFTSRSSRSATRR